MEKVGADQAALRLVQWPVWIECHLHLGGPRLEDRKQVSVPAIEVLEHLGQLSGPGIGIEPQDPIDDMVGSDPIGRVEIPRLGGRLEGSNDDPCRIGAQVERLTVYKCGMSQLFPLVR